MSYVTKGRTEIICRDNVGGIRNVYLMKYIYYPITSIVGGMSGYLKEFPTSILYKYETQNANFSETINNDENGIYFEQSLNFDLIKQDFLTTKELDAIRDLELRYVVEFNNGLYRVGGLYNGSNIENFSIDSGGAKSSFNGYKVSIKSREEYAAPFIDNLTVITGSNNYIFMDGNNFVFMDGNNYIFN